MNTNRRSYGKLLIVFLAAGLVACSTTSKRDNPLNEFQRSYAPYDEYTVVLDDMRVEGNFFKEYQHRYKVLHSQLKAGTTDQEFVEANIDWRPVPQRFFQQLERYLGMVILSKGADGKVDKASYYPPAYHYVGNSRYGSWQRNSSGTSFWAFYGGYRLLGDVFGSSRRPVYQNDYNSYRTHRSSNRPYFGPTNATGGPTYGTRGSYTKQSRPSFYKRQQVRQAAGKRSFGERVKSRSSSSNRTGRSQMSSTRSRSSSRGGK
jgi:hypothetical protein